MFSAQLNLAAPLWLTLKVASFATAAALFPLLRARLRKGLREIQSRFQIPVIMITHDPEDIDAFAETLVVYETGQVRHISPFYKQTKNDVPAECFLRSLRDCPA